MGDTIQLVEIEQSRIVRPEMFHRPEVSGIAVPLLVRKTDQLIPIWMSYLRWHDDERRELRSIDDGYIDTGDGQLWLHPEPPGPVPNMFPTWSLASREAWVNGAPPPKPVELFKRICDRIAFFIEFPIDVAKGALALIALWVILTYCYLTCEAVPYLYIGGAVGAGKTRLMQILARLVFRPLTSDNATAPFIFRTLHARGGVLLLDEAEQLRQSTPDVQALNSMLLAGYKRGGQATRLEPVGDTYKPVCFDVYGPKALACIAGLPQILASRCIEVTMFRAAPDSPRPKRRLDADPPAWQSLRNDLHALALEYGPVWLDLAQRDDVVPPWIANRNYELYQPILALAVWIESQGANGLKAIVEEYARATMADLHDEMIPAADEALLQIVATHVRADAQRQLTPSMVLARAQRQDSSTFGTIERPNRWSPTRVGRTLKRYGVRTRHTGNRRTYQDVSAEQMQRIQEHYGVCLGIEPAERTNASNTSNTTDTSQGSTVVGGGRQ